MIDFELEQMMENPEWCLVLNHYRESQLQAKKRDPEFDGWIIRQNEVEGVVLEHLPRIHGKLIAFDLLKFQISGRDSGVFYQVARMGEKMLPKLQKMLKCQSDSEQPESDTSYAKSA
ncbi:hypothetical protein [uncultured Gimesia sp.]|uniref:hypothetical protein n=1 Tax=uncultured Gimesia sp. TaxID=1678688 RepID=UPI0030D7CCB8